jgi:hypothetical protein
MSKYEREWSEIAEKAVADGLSGQAVSVSVQLVVDEIKKLVSELNPNDTIQNAVWVGGNNYKDPGDVHVYLVSGKIERIELKFSRGFGEGTAKNLGGKTFTKKISTTITSYPEHEKDLKEQRKVLVESSIGRTLKNDSDYVRQLRAMRETDEEKFNVLKEQLSSITSPGQITYAQYAAEQLNQYLANVNILVNSILGSNAKVVVRQDLLYCVVKYFESDKQTVEFYDFLDMDRTISNIVSEGKSIKFQNSKGRDVLRFSVHWKNICQGGATPCFNVFIGNEFQSK